ncbi:sigma factor G inhibitor Gin [Fodinisporobacter ferrooxydans]|uniref:Sigma factor G inhibitor Gin n=1 Tax=Fodinisporobacter ferrooxydans TaxID=2901836 RepID=A0ABY4CV77_9BACL|nr:sigma factor G inhibitor Gin [Alicyclobacillaceae bacterium MYW30-H2]
MQKPLQQNLNEDVCIVCNVRRSAGIHIWGQFICDVCERNIVKTEVSDEKYYYYIQKLKKIWLEATS